MSIPEEILIYRRREFKIADLIYFMSRWVTILQSNPPSNFSSPLRILGSHLEGLSLRYFYSGVSHTSTAYFSISITQTHNQPSNSPIVRKLSELPDGLQHSQYLSTPPCSSSGLSVYSMICLMSAPSSRYSGWEHWGHSLYLSPSPERTSGQQTNVLSIQRKRVHLLAFSG